MAEANGPAVTTAENHTTSSTTTLEALQKQSSHSRRLRPPDLTDQAAEDEARVPLRAGPKKLGHRESRLGLRGLFARNKGAVQDMRASIADFGSWPYSFHGTRSETALPRNPSPTRPAPQPPVSSTPEPTLQPTPAPQPASKQAASTSSSSTASSKSKKPVIPTRSRTPAPSTRTGRGSLATWDPPPLFQAYPQAIKHAQLPACAMSIDALQRLQGHRSGGSVGGGISVRAPSSSDSGEDGAATDKPTEKPKKKHRRNLSGSSLDWVNKIYVLVTSGYLLQYAAEGSFDRLPEKILHVSKDSAAFASDLIPGRHWVLQVCSAMDADGTQASDSRSLFSRLPFRGSERRHASTFLMVFENAEEMESWITTLRREIEHFGGKKSLSETGKPKTDVDFAQRREPPSQRTLVVRDPERFSRIINPQDLLPLSSRRDSSVSGVSGVSEAHLGAPPVGPIIIHERDPASDDMSTTNSVYSVDGRQLENLRDSSGNRFSYISSGQRTMVTSDSSSPPCSPVRDSFVSMAGDEPLPYSDSPKEARPRPNAAAIIERRQSLQVTANQRLSDLHTPQQTTQPLVQPRLPVSSFTAAAPFTPSNTHNGHAQGPPPAAPLPTIPNFSVPHLASKRYSAVVRSPTSEAPTAPFQRTTPMAATIQPAPEPRPQAQPAPAVRHSSRRLPPPSLAFSRPLSIVTDHPSPGATSPPLSRGTSNAAIDKSNRDSAGYDSDVPDTAALFSPWSTSENQTMPEQTLSSSLPSEQNEYRRDVQAVSKSSISTQFHVTVRTSPRRHSSMVALRSSDAAPGRDRPEMKPIVIPYRENMPLPTSKFTLGAPQMPKAEQATQYRRASMFAQPSSGSSSMALRPASMYHRGVVSHKGSFSQPEADAQGGLDGSLDASRGRANAKPEPLGVRALPPNEHLRVRSTSSKAILNRRSMPQLADGPPPAPPPTCALPPLPSKPSELDLRRRTLQV